MSTRSEIADEAKATLQHLASIVLDDENVYAEEIPSRPYARIARHKDDVLLLLPPTNRAATDSISLKHLGIKFDVACEVTQNGSTSSEIIVIIRLANPTNDLITIFCEVVALLLSELENFDSTHVGDVVDSLIELFISEDEPNSSTIIGLWGELLLIYSARDPDLVGSAWHANPNDRFDYSRDLLRIEVKSTQGQRRHNFSLPQVQANASHKIAIASLVLVPSTDGISIFELLEATESRISDQHVKKHVRNTAFRILGTLNVDNQTIFFDPEASKDNFRFFDAVDIPKPHQIDVGVSEVRFIADLQLTPEINQEEFERWGELSKAVIDRKSLR
jgi:hypothetical protein